jgi:signal transduction histidine kinase
MVVGAAIPSKDSAGQIGQVLLIETAGADDALLFRKLRKKNLKVELSKDLKEACRRVNQDKHDLVVAGPRLDTLNLRRIAEIAGRQQSNLRMPVLNLGSLYQARDAKEFLGSVVVTAAALMDSSQAFAFLCDPPAGAPDLASLCIGQNGSPELEVTLRRCFDRIETREPAMTDRGGQGVAASDIHVFMIPVVHNSGLQAMLGIVSRQRAEEPVAGRLEMLRLLSQISGPFLAALRDAEQLRNRADELEAFLHIKSHLMSNMCHEFRSLLAAVRGYSSRLLDGRAGAISNVQHDHVTVVLRNCNKLLDLVSYSAPFATEQKLRLERFDLRETWQHALKRLRRRASEESIRILEQIPSEPFTVFADKERLEAVFDILLANAVQCVTASGEITVRFLRATNGEVTVRLFAAGAALPAQLLDTIFDHTDDSGRASPQDKRRFAGLPLLHDLVWLHGGRISVTSNSGEGTEFTFSLQSP